MDLSDDFFMGWLARDARFQASVHFAPKCRLGYTVHRKVYASMDEAPRLTMWLREKGINGRVLRDRDEISRLLSLLGPVWEVVKDRDSLERLMLTMDATSMRKMKHDEMCELIQTLDSL